MSTRTTSVAGSFYPREKAELCSMIDGLLKDLPEEQKTKCVVSPHAGYAYSGKTAAYSFNALQESKTFVILGTGHTGLGPAISVSDADDWETPLGNMQVDSALRQKLLEKLGIEADDLAHIEEHSIELQLPFLQSLFKGFKILPINLMEYRLPELKALGEALASLEEGFSLIASGDFTHHEPLEIAKEKDLNAIKKIEAMDVAGFYHEVTSKHLSICGFAPITAQMYYCKAKGFAKGRLFHYDTSATATGEEASVVGYAAIGFY